MVTSYISYIYITLFLIYTNRYTMFAMLHHPYMFVTLYPYCGFYIT
jgi:hypothetical protein